MKANKFSLIFAFFFVLFSVSALAQTAIVSPTNPDTNNDLTCSVSTGNPGSYIFRWFLGTSQYNGNTVYASQTTRGQTWVCKIYSPPTRFSGVVEKSSASVTIRNTAPIVSANGPYAGIERQPIAFTGTASDPVDGDAITSWLWDFGDGTTGNTQNPTKTYFQNGTYTVTLRATDAGGASTTSAATVSTIADTLPNAIFTASTTVTSVGTVVFFNDMSIMNDFPSARTFDFNNDGIVDYSYSIPAQVILPAATVNTTYSLPGNYTVNFTISDIDGALSSATQNIEVLANPDFTAPATITNLLATNVTNSTITWNWTNPVDVDFAGTNVFIDGVNVINLTNIDTAYVGTFLPNTTHTITIFTKDLVGNINSTVVNNTASTLASPVAPPTQYFSLNLTSLENNSLTSNLGSLLFNALAQPFGLVNATSGNYVINFTPALGYNFNQWLALGGISVFNVSDPNTVITVSGNGSLTAVYFNNTVVVSPFAPNITFTSPATPININISQSLDFNITAVDPENSNLTVNWTLNGVPASGEVITSGSNSGISFTFPLNGTFTVGVTVTDNQSLTDFYSWIVNVVNNTVVPPVGNQAPVIVLPLPLSPLTINISTLQSFNLTVVDPEGQNMFVNWTVNGNVTQSTTELNNSLVSFSNLFNQNGTFTVTADVYDTTNTSLFASNSWIVNVVNNSVPPVNNPPVLNAVGNQTVNEGNTLTVTLNATDLDLDILTFGTDATFGSLAGNVFTFTPNSTQSGNYTVMFNVTDGTDFDFEIINIEVLDVPAPNNPPVLVPIGNQTLFENNTLTLFINATDADNDPLTFGVSALPSGATFVGQTFSFTPNFAQSGNYSLTFNVTDGQAVSQETINIEVLDVTVPIHDVLVSRAYVNNVNGVRVSTDIGLINVTGNLTQGQVYRIGYRTDNIGNVAENVVVYNTIYNSTGSVVYSNSHNHLIASGANFADNTDAWNTTGLAPGLYTIFVNTTITSDSNLSNNIGSRVVNIVYLDVVTPSVSTVTPIIANEDALVNYFATVSDNVAVASCNLYVNGANSGLMTLNGGTANGSLIIATPGIYNVLANCTDAAGNYNDTSVTSVTINDITRPDVTNVLPVAASVFNVGTSMQLSADVSDNVAVNLTYANVTRPGGLITQVPLNFVSGTTYNNNYAIPNVTGTYNVRFYARDNAGNVNSTVTTFFVSGDTVLPIVTITSPTAGTKTTSTVLIDFTATDNVAVNNRWYRIDAGANTPYTVPVVSPSLSNGAHTLIAFANDTSGNVANSSVSFTIDTTGRASGTSRDQASALLSGVNVSIQGTPFSVLTSGAGTYAINGINPGTYTFTATKAGYLSQTRTGQVISSNQTTVVDFVLVQGGNLGGTVYDFWLFPGTIPGATVELIQGGVVVSTTTTNGFGVYSFTTIAPGYYDVRASRVGYTTQTQSSNHVLAGQTTTVNFALG